MKFFLLIFGFLLISASLLKANSFTFEADATIEKEFNMQEVKGLHFGKIKLLSVNSDETRSTIILPSNGTLKSGKNYSVDQNTASNGLIEISGKPNSTVTGLNIIVTAPLVGENGDTLEARLFHSNILPLNLDGNGKALIKIGGELTFNPNSVSGKYNGKYRVLLSY